jgi:predicted Fe-Mo cluster-binding NifX family protein
MNVVVTSQGTDLDSPVDPRFGRAKFLILVDTEAGTFTAHNNTKNLNAAQGAGIQTAQNVASLGPAAVITGHVGPKAFATLEAGQVRTYTGASGSVRDALERFKTGQLESASEPDVDGHWI